MKISKLSIITVVYNDAEGLKKTIESIIEQKKIFPAIEYIVIDGGSTDSTVDVIKGNKSDIDKWVSERDGGIYDAMNKGIRLSTGDSLLFINAGDYFVGDVLGKVESAPCFLPVKYIDIIGRFKKRAILNIRRGISNCHQGIIFEKKNIFYDMNYKICADYKYFIDYKYDSHLPMVNSPGYIFFDAAGGVSSTRIKERDMESYQIQKYYFGTLSAVIFSIPAFMKRILRKIIKIFRSIYR